MGVLDSTLQSNITVSSPVECGGGAPWEGSGASKGCSGFSQTGGPLHTQGSGGNGSPLWEDEECSQTPAAHQLLVRLGICEVVVDKCKLVSIIWPKSQATAYYFTYNYWTKFQTLLEFPVEEIWLKWHCSVAHSCHTPVVLLPADLWSPGARFIQPMNQA